MVRTRFFVANLPTNTTEDQLKELFQDYGYVERVELKTKENLFAPESVKVIAFVTLQIQPSEINNCVQALNWEKLNGSQLKVNVAKESFLERLKREREEAQRDSTNGGTNDEQSYGTDAGPLTALLPQSAENTRKIFTEEELTALENDDNIAADLLISKKRAANSLHNGRIVIQSFDVAPLHIIDGVPHKGNKGKKTEKSIDAKDMVAEQKRKESQNKMSKQYKAKKTAIQQALSGMDASQAKKIRFSDSEEDENTNDRRKSKTNLFESDYEEKGDDDDQADDIKLELKTELFGKKGAKLVKMQSKQSLDPRFRIDAKFVDDDDNDYGDDGEDVLAEAGQENAVNGNNINERDWQMGILEQVVGTKLDTADNAQKAARKKRMLRYDPAKERHQKLLRTTHSAQGETDEEDKDNDEPVTTTILSTAAQKTKKKKQLQQQQQMAKDKTITTPSNAPPEVSKEVFYVVTDTLAESLKTRGEGFSLLNMFGNAQANEKRHGELRKVADAKIFVNRLDKNAINPFKYDTSSEEEEADEALGEAKGASGRGDTVSKEQQQQMLKKTKQQSNKIVCESFFIPRNDARLKEGAKFFRCEKSTASAEDYEAVRNRLKMLIRTKINKTKKNCKLGGGGGVGHKRRIKGRN